jgi:hypothetical protein
LVTPENLVTAFFSIACDPMIDSLEKEASTIYQMMH